MATGDKVPSRPHAHGRAGAIAGGRRGLRIHVSSVPMHLIGAADLRVVDAERAARPLHRFHARSIFEKVWRQTGAGFIRQFAQRIGLAGRTLCRVTDVELHNLVATAIERGELLVLHEEVVPPEERATPASPMGEDAPAPRPAPRPAMPAMPALAPAPAPEPVDVAAQIQTLIAAARDGVPFCEECAKAARARQQAA